MVGAGLVLFWVVVALLAPILPLNDPNEPLMPFQPIISVPQPDGTVLTLGEGAGYPGDVGPNGETLWFGLDHKGRDMLSRVIWGSRTVLFWATFATAVAYAVGMIMGVMAGYFGRWVDEVISFIANVLLSFPVLVLYIVIITNLGPSGTNVVLAVTFASAPQIMRIVRGLALDIKTRDYIAAAQTRGESALYIMFVELLPNAKGPLIVDACLRLGYTTIAIATLGFLGLGLPPPDADWGKIIVESMPSAQFAPHMVVIPAIAISSLVLGFNLMADGLREIAMRD
ncbi:MAG: ABC transporter permease [Alphaproteobacteria bacterium]|nr:ABC transporter permease [Alphaproteobacteria bacterium]MDX5369410.1 ABC transporter permease [Alphaproteobacteria bacterium]MDX5464093.1 ABC transporter permease [Alphaproteobacteria bacterium]